MNKPLSLSVLLKRRGYNTPLSDVLHLLHSSGIIQRLDSICRCEYTINPVYSSYVESSRTRKGLLMFYPESFDELMQEIGVD